jgi:hypothetical protein
MSAWGSLGAVVFAVVAIGATLWLADRDRKRSEQLRQQDLAAAAQDRAEADARLIAERAAADQRLRDERADRDRRQARDWQAAAAVRLLERIAGIQPHLVRLTNHQTSPVAQPDRTEAIRHLRDGAMSDALALGDANGTLLYRTLAGLVVGATPAMNELQRTGSDGATLGASAEMLALNVRRYSRYVRLWLHHLIEHGSIPDHAVGPARSLHAPILTALTAQVAWTPIEHPAGWDEDTDLDPDDPQSRLYPRR